MPAPLKHGPWRLTDLADVPKNGLKVFSCFHGGGGSTMGYKLAGYDVMGGVEIDPEMMAIYRANHKPRHSYLMGVQQFKQLPDADLPPELFDLDILDGSPPCSSFSMAGSREKAWGKAKTFREGQAKQVLDDLFFHFIDIARKLKPKVVIAENVKGLVQGNARGYVKEIFRGFAEAGYRCQMFLLNASRMGVPQARERTFFLASCKNIGFWPIKMVFVEMPISLAEAIVGVDDKNHKLCSPDQRIWWEKTRQGEAFSKKHPKGSWFNSFRCNPNSPVPTVIASARQSASGLYHWSIPRHLSAGEYRRLQTFPEDYKYNSLDPVYIYGMSVPPFMMQRLALEVERQWLAAPQLKAIGGSA